jgi:hypothetical protein
MLHPQYHHQINRRCIIDFLLGPTHDIVWNNGPLTKEYTTQPFVENVAQRLKIRLLTFKGEWFINTAYGMPYWQEILGRKINKGKVDRIFQQEILAENGVKEIVSFSSTLVNRQYNLTFKVKVFTDELSETITITPTI